MEDLTFIDLLNLLNCDPVFTYELVTTNGRYDVVTHWYENGYGYHSKTIISVDKYKDLKELLCKEVKRLFK